MEQRHANPNVAAMATALTLSPDFVERLDAGGSRFVADLDDADTEQAVRLGLLHPTGGDLLHLDPGAVAFLRGSVELSPEIQLRLLTTPAVKGELADQLENVLRHRSTMVELVSSPDSMAPAFAASAMLGIGLSPVVLDLGDIVADEAPVLMRSILLQCRLLGLGPILLCPDPLSASRAFYGLLTTSGWPVVLVVTDRQREFVPTGNFSSLHGSLGSRGRGDAWSNLLPDGHTVTEAQIEVLSRMPLSIRDMNEAYVRAATDAAARATDDLELERFARQVLVEGVSRLAQFRDSHHAHPLALSRETAAVLHDLTAAARRFADREGPQPQGLRAIFSGPSGTGKTAAAQQLAAELGRPLLVVEVSRIVDKYIGETEKNLDRLLEEADRARAILLFDEGESLFGSRSNAGGAGVEASNRQIAYLLTRLEQHSGIVLLASNFPGVIDSAFLRRFHFHITFKVPPATDRARIWSSILERHALTVDDVTTFTGYELTGGQISNICYLAGLSDAPHDDLSSVIVRLIENEYARSAKRIPTIS